MVKRDYRAGRCLRGLTVIGAVSLALLGASTTARGQEIRVEFLDARTGRPVTYESAQLWVESVRGFLSAPANNKEGTARFFYTGHSIRPIWPPNTRLRYSWQGELTVPPGIGRIASGPTVAAGVCWDLGPSRLGPWYPISEILQHGAVSENHCGKATAKPKPGELTLFIEPLSFWRRFLDGFRS
jgi:hypothetical protein